LNNHILVRKRIMLSSNLRKLGKMTIKFVCILIYYYAKCDWSNKPTIQ